MRILDDKIAHLLGEAVKATNEGQKMAAAGLVRLLRSGPVDQAVLDEMAADIAKTWGPEVKGYFRELCRKSGLCG